MPPKPRPPKDPQWVLLPLVLAFRAVFQENSLLVPTDCCKCNDDFDVCLSCYNKAGEEPLCPHTRDTFKARYTEDYITSFEEHCPWVWAKTLPNELQRSAWFDSARSFNKFLKSDLSEPHRICIAVLDDGVDLDYLRFAEAILRRSDCTSIPSALDTDLRRRLTHGTAIVKHVVDVFPHVRIVPVRLDTSPNGEVGARVVSEAIKWCLSRSRKVDIICLTATSISRSSSAADRHELRTRLDEATNLDNNVLIFFPTGEAKVDYSRVFSISIPKPPLPTPSPETLFFNFNFPEDGLVLDAVDESDARTVWHGNPVSCATAAGLAAMLLYCARKTGKVAVWTDWMADVFGKMTRVDDGLEFVDIRNHLREEKGMGGLQGFLEGLIA